MGVMRLESAKFQHWSNRPAIAALGYFDPQLIIYATLLMGLGLVMAYSNDYSQGVAPFSAGSTFTRGLLWAMLATVVFVVAAAIDYRWLKSFAGPIYVIDLGLLVTTLAVGSGVGGSARWVSVLGMQFQFSELAKILTAIVLASWIARRRDQIRSFWTIVGAGVLVGPALVLVALQPDLGTSLVFLAILAGTLFISGANLRWLSVLAAGAVASFPLVWTYLLHDYQRQRLISFLDPAADPQGSGYHVIQSMLAVASGGPFGKGLTNGTAGQLNFLPVQSTDFVFAMLSQELGFVGGLVVVGLFVALLWRVLLVAWHSEDLFGVAFAGGMASLLLFQMLVNMGMVIGIMPITGIPLPFITYGGASLVSTAAGLGILQSINLRQAKPKW